MAHPRYEDGSVDDFMARSLGERVIGGKKRSTFTYVPREETVIDLGVLETYIYRLTKAIRRAHEAKHPYEPLTDKELAERYPSIQTYADFHQDVIEHLSSLKGFSVNRALGHGERDEPGREESSVTSDEQPTTKERWR